MNPSHPIGAHGDSLHVLRTEIESNLTCLYPPQNHSISFISLTLFLSCGIADETLSHLALSSITVHSQATDAIPTFIAKVSDVLSTPPPTSRRPASDEWLYGRAGTLYLLRLIRHFIAPNADSFSCIDESISAVSAKIISEGPDWRWHGKQYLGAVHGSIGILTQIILSSSLIPAAPPRACWKWLNDILGLQFESGNWPSSLGNRAQRDELVQFCHGAPGFVISLLAIRKAILNMDADPVVDLTGELGDDLEVNVRELCQAIDTAISKARTCIKQRGVLTKEPCLCHGVAGNALALEGEESKGMMDWAQESVIRRGLKDGWYAKGDDAAGLFCGEAGRAWGWMVMGGWGEGMIGFSDVCEKDFLPRYVTFPYQ